MAEIAILGATSHIAGDYIRGAHAAGHVLHLYSRRPQEVADWLAALAGVSQYSSDGYDEFGKQRYDAVVNFVGSGDPARTISMGATILEVTRKFDELAIGYLKSNPKTRYVFLSSGAVYGSEFDKPVEVETPAQIPINAIVPQNFYSVAKLYAEVSHRALAELPIVDLRIFGYFSRSVALTTRFLLTDIARAISDRSELEVEAATIYRDYIVPRDFFALVEAVLRAPPVNAALDSYSLAPVEKFELLDAMKEQLGLRYRRSSTASVIRATGLKRDYYSRNRKAEAYGYKPSFGALDGVMTEMRALLAAR